MKPICDMTTVSVIYCFLTCFLHILRIFRVLSFSSDSVSLPCLITAPYIFIYFASHFLGSLSSADSYIHSPSSPCKDTHTHCLVVSYTVGVCTPRPPPYSPPPRSSQRASLTSVSVRDTPSLVRQPRLSGQMFVLQYRDRETDTERKIDRQAEIGRARQTDRQRNGRIESDL